MVLGSPGTRQVFRGLLRGANATAHTQHHVRLTADFAVGGQQQVIQVHPGMVAASVAVLHLHDDHGIRVVLGDLQDRTNLLHGARLEADVGEAILVQALDQLLSFLQLGDTGGHGHAVDGGACGAGARNNTLRAKLQVPHVAVEEHGVELRCAARLQLGHQAVTILGEHFLRILATTGQLGPETSVSGCCDNIRVHGGGGHARQQDWGVAGQAAKRGDNLHAAVRQLHQLRGEPLPGVLLRDGGTGSDQLVAIRSGASGNEGDAAAVEKLGGDAGQAVTRLGVQHMGDLGAGGQRRQLCGPIVVLDQNVLGKGLGGYRQTKLGGPLGGAVRTGLHCREVERRGNLEFVEQRLHPSTARTLIIQLRVMLLRSLLNQALHLAQCRRRTRNHKMRVAITQRQFRVLDLRNGALNSLARHITDTQHPGIPRVRAQFLRAQGGSSAHQQGKRHYIHQRSVLLHGLTAGVRRDGLRCGHAQAALGMPDERGL